MRAVLKERQVYVEDRLQTRDYEAKGGSGKSYRTEIIAQRVQFLGGRGVTTGESHVAINGGGEFRSERERDCLAINPQCRVIGSTGIVWGHTALTRKPKDGPLTTLFVHFTFIFAKTDGQWREVAVHMFQLPHRRLTMVRVVVRGWLLPPPSRAAEIDKPSKLEKIARREAGVEPFRMRLVYIKCGSKELT